jgi:hypothetical protein
MPAHIAVPHFACKNTFYILGVDWCMTGVYMPLCTQTEHRRLMARFIECDRGQWVNLDHIIDIKTVPLNGGGFSHLITLVGKGFAEKTTDEPIDWRAEAAAA